jgi:hypothetical protein
MSFANDSCIPIVEKTVWQALVDLHVSLLAELYGNKGRVMWLDNYLQAIPPADCPVISLWPGSGKMTTREDIFTVNVQVFHSPLSDEKTKSAYDLRRALCLMYIRNAKTNLTNPPLVSLIEVLDGVKYTEITAVEVAGVQFRSFQIDIVIREHLGDGV